MPSGYLVVLYSGVDDTTVFLARRKVVITRARLMDWFLMITRLASTNLVTRTVTCQNIGSASVRLLYTS